MNREQIIYQASGHVRCASVLADLVRQLVEAINTGEDRATIQSRLQAVSRFAESYEQSTQTDLLKVIGAKYWDAMTSRMVPPPEHV